MIIVIKIILYILIVFFILLGTYKIIKDDDKKVGYISFVFSVLVFIISLIPIGEKNEINEDEPTIESSISSSKTETTTLVEITSPISSEEECTECTESTNGVMEETEFESNYITKSIESTSAITTETIKMEYIANMELFADGIDGYTRNTYLTDNYRNTYSSSISVDSGYISYLVKNMGYTHFCGTIALPKEVKPDGYTTSAQLEIYIDDDLAFRSDTFTSESKPQKFDLDITNAEVIKISWTCSGMNIWSNWCYYATIFDAYFSDDYYTYSEKKLNSTEIIDKDVVYIADEELFATNAEKIYVNDFLTTNYNDEYLTSFAVDKGYASFLVKDREFTSFSGIVALPKEVKPDGYTTSAQLEIYIDDDLAFRSDTFTSESKPQQFDLDITNAEVIKISWTCSGMNIWSNWCYYATIFDGKFKK